MTCLVYSKLVEMPDVCRSCGRAVENIDCLKCAQCKVAFHFKCVKNYDQRIPRKNWKCDACVPAAASPTPKAAPAAGGDAQAVLAAIAVFRQESSARLEEFRKETNDRLDKVDTSLRTLEALEDRLNTVCTDISELKIQVGEDKLKNEETSNNVNLLLEENVKLKKDLAAVRREVMDLQQHSRKNNILVSGVPVTPRENVYVILSDIAALIEV